MSTTNEPMTTTQTVLVVLISITAVLLVVSLLVRQGGPVQSVDRETCLDRGDVWSQVDQRCYSSQAQTYPASFVAACNNQAAVDIILRDESTVQLVLANGNDKRVETLTRVPDSQWQYEGEEGAVQLSLSGQTADIRTDTTQYRGCSVSPREPTPDADTKRIALKPGQTGTAGNVRITFNQVVQDNRCPIDTTCINGGGITVGVKLFSQGLQENINLSSDGVAYKFGDHAISIPHVEPPRFNRQGINDDDYRVTFWVATSTANS